MKRRNFIKALFLAPFIPTVVIAETKPKLKWNMASSPYKLATDESISFDEFQRKILNQIASAYDVSTESIQMDFVPYINYDEYDPWQYIDGKLHYVARKPVAGPLKMGVGS